MSESDETQSIIQLLSVIYVQQARMLDVLYLMAEKNGGDVERLIQLHTNGGLLGPEPWLRDDDEETE